MSALQDEARGIRNFLPTEGVLATPTPSTRVLQPQPAMLQTLIALLLPALDLPPVLPTLPDPQPGVEALGYPAAALGTGAEFRDADLVDLDDDGGLDAVLLDGQRIVTLHWVEACTTSAVLRDAAGADVLANGMDLGTDVQGTPRLAIVGPGGLGIFAWSANQATFVATGDLTPQLADAVSVEWVDWNLDGVDELFVLQASRQAAVVLEDDGQGTWVQLASFAFPVPVDQALPIDYLPSSECELAVVHGGGLELYAAGAPTPFYTRGSTTGAGLLARARGLAATDRLLWLTGPFGSDHVVVAFEHSVGVFDVLTISEGQPTTIATGDRDLDGDDDLVLTLASTPDVLLVELEESTEGVFVSAAQRYALIEPVPTPRGDGPGNVAGARFADLDADGAVDLFVASSDAYECYVAHLPDMQEAPHTTGGFEGFVPGSLTGTLDGNGALLHGWLEATYPSEITQLEITTWHRPESDAFTEGSALSICIQPVVPGAQQHAIELAVPATQFIDDAHTVFYTVRPLNAQGRLAYAPAHLAYSTEPTNLDDLDSAEGWDGTELVTFAEGSSGSHQGVPVGGVKGTDRVSPFQPGVRPSTADAGCVTTGS